MDILFKKIYTWNFDSNYYMKGCGNWKLADTPFILLIKRVRITLDITNFMLVIFKNQLFEL